jgi:hypothetical protein
MNGKRNMQNMTLSPIIKTIKDLKGTFSKISFHHIYRELNDSANELSKEALSLHTSIH